MSPINLTPDDHLVFSLRFDNLEVGKLTFSDHGYWSFEYSDSFKRLQPIQPLFEFPDLNRRYSGNHLSSFFELRIPSFSREDISIILEKENIARENKPRLLERFGRWSAANPFELVPS
jgi:HipA-like protein